MLFEVNARTLNTSRLWTWRGSFAIALMVLAITGMAMMKGDRGITGRGKWFVGAGLLVPIGFVIYMYS